MVGEPCIGPSSLFELSCIARWQACMNYEGTFHLLSAYIPQLLHRLTKHTLEFVRSNWVRSWPTLMLTLYNIAIRIYNA